MNAIELMATEAGLINAMFQRNAIRAKVDKRFAKVEALQRELSTALGNGRLRLRLPGDIHAIPVTFPRLAFELPPPNPSHLTILSILSTNLL